MSETSRAGLLTSVDDDIVDEGVYAEQDGATLTTEKASRQNQLKDIVLQLAVQGSGWKTGIHRLLDEGADVNHRYGRSMKTLFQLLCTSLSKTLHQLSRRKIKEKESEVTSHFQEKLRVLLSAGADVNVTDQYGNTVLHMIASARVPWPLDCLKKIIELTKKVIDNCNESGETALVILYEKTPSREVFEEFVKAGSNLRKLSAEQVTRLFRSAIDQGTIDTLEVLINYRESFGSDKDPFLASDHGLLHLAASSSQDALKKIDVLIANGCNIHASDSHGWTVLHEAAKADNPDVIKKALEMEVDPGKPNVVNWLPIHYCADRDDSECFTLLVGASSDDHLHALTNNGQSLLSIAAKKTARRNITILLEAGCSVRKSRLKRLKYDPSIITLVERETILASSAPVACALELSEALKYRASIDVAHSQQILEKAAEAEQLAIEISDCVEWNNCRKVITDDLIFYAVDRHLKKFTASATVQKRLRGLWYGNYEVPLRKRWYLVTVPIFVLSMLFLPMIMILQFPKDTRMFYNYNRITHRLLLGRYSHDRVYRRYSSVIRRYCCWLDPRLQILEIQPVVTFLGSVLSYVAFLVLLITKVILDAEKSRCDDLEIGNGCRQSYLDWILFAFVVGLIVQEASKMLSLGFTVYIRCFSNVFDLVMMFLFVAYYLLEMVGFYSNVDISARYQLVRLSYHVLGLAALMSCLRLLSYLQAHSMLGPIHLSFMGITLDVVMFLIILGTFLTGFSLSVTSIYSARLYSPGAPPNATEPYEVGRFWISLKTLFWSLFGMTDDTVFKNGSDVENSLEVVVGTALFALWLIVAIVVLLNMLIALISNSFQRVQDNADVEWKFAMATIIRDIQRAPLIPVPLNLVHILYVLISHIFWRLCCLCKTYSEYERFPESAFVFYEEPESMNTKKATKTATEEMVQKYKEKIASNEKKNSAKNANLEEIWSLVHSSMSTMESKILREFNSLKERLDVIENRLGKQCMENNSSSMTPDAESLPVESQASDATCM